MNLLINNFFFKIKKFKNYFASFLLIEKQFESKTKYENGEKRKNTKNSSFSSGFVNLVYVYVYVC